MMKFSKFDVDLVLKLVEAEAERKGEEKIVVGNKAYSYSEFYKRVKSGDKECKKILDMLVNVVKNSAEIRRAIVRFLDESSVDSS